MSADGSPSDRDWKRAVSPIEYRIDRDLEITNAIKWDVDVREIAGRNVDVDESRELEMATRSNPDDSGIAMVVERRLCASQPNDDSRCRRAKIVGSEITNGQGTSDGRLF